MSTLEKEEKRFKVVTLGCRTNQYESQAYTDQLKKMGFVKAKENETADVCIVNTCTVTESADKKSIYQIKHLAKENKDAKIVVTGCLVERRNSVVKDLEMIDTIVPNNDKENLLSYLYPDEDLPEFKIERFEAHTRAFVKIQDGCNSYCSYCVIPFVRGRSRSKNTSEIIKEVKGLIENGFKEIVLTGINIGDFDGGEEKASLADLVRLIDDLEGIERIRISSIDPDEIDDDLLDAVINGKHTCHSMHIVLQAGSNSVLKRMNRKYTKQEFLYATDRLKNASADFTFTTDVIVGFPTETEEDFRESLEMIDRVQFAKVHMFPYSVRPYTKAARLPNHLPKDVITKRKNILLRHAEKAAFKLRDAYVGRVLSILCESEDPKRNGYITGHSDNFLQVSFPKETSRNNELVKVKILRNEPDVLIGEIV
ncbi:MAG: Threonylcarbamoyladenosine tRNA methylthiotransferase MtaB [Chlamydiia bacterium]|nr:Threonylcarbamoyladenosine tRNA methylthiotransferase MtaB [Chlamydiia bacterium]